VEAPIEVDDGGRLEVDGPRSEVEVGGRVAINKLLGGSEKQGR
jgi:hypothetical protein